jgi:hypothetical protein
LNRNIGPAARRMALFISYTPKRAAVINKVKQKVGKLLLIVYTLKSGIVIKKV